MNFEGWWKSERHTWHLDDEQEGLAYLAAEIAWNAALDEAVKEILFNNCIANTGKPNDKDIALLRSIEAIKELKE